jgi:hypothetical protein
MSDTPKSFAEISLRYVHWLWPAINQEETRYYLSGILIEPSALGGAVLVATDGCVLIAVHDKAAKVDRKILWKPSKPLVRAASAQEFLSEKGSPDPAPRTIKLDAALWGEEIESEFPNWRKVVPQAFQTDGEAVFFGRELLKFRNVGSRDEKMIVLGGKSVGESKDRHAAQPALVMLEGHPEFLGVIMPRIHNESSQKSFVIADWV